MGKLMKDKFKNPFQIRMEYNDISRSRTSGKALDCPEEAINTSRKWKWKLEEKKGARGRSIEKH